MSIQIDDYSISAIVKGCALHNALSNFQQSKKNWILQWLRTCDLHSSAQRGKTRRSIAEEERALEIWNSCCHQHPWLLLSLLEQKVLPTIIDPPQNGPHCPWRISGRNQQEWKSFCQIPIRCESSRNLQTCYLPLYFVQMDNWAEKRAMATRKLWIIHCWDQSYLHKEEMWNLLKSATEPDIWHSWESK